MNYTNRARNDDIIINTNSDETNEKNINMDENKNDTTMVLINLQKYVLCLIAYVILEIYMIIVLIITLPLTSIKNFTLESVRCIIKTLKSLTKTTIEFYEEVDECFENQMFILRKIIDFILVLIFGIFDFIYALTKISIVII